MTAVTSREEGSKTYCVRFDHLSFGVLDSNQYIWVLTRVSSYFLAFASDLHKRLPTIKDDTSAAEALLAEVQAQVQTLEKYSSKPNHGMLGDEDLDQEGTNLWNLCTRLKRESAVKVSQAPILRVIMASRVMAYQMLHLCQWSPKASVNITCHLMRIALKAAKVCTGMHCTGLLSMIRNIVC